METLKSFLFNRFRTVFLVVSITGLSLFLLMIRLKLTHSFFLLFLVWNLFLAAIPFFITFYLSSKEHLKKWPFAICFFLWLLFLPNAPYIITDFIHLQHLKANMVVLDFLLISSCALSGLLFYLVSLTDMEIFLRRFSTEKRTKVMMLVIPFLCGFGIYLGRFLRWNSWDILQNPSGLMQNIFHIIFHPTQHMGAWLVTFSFGIGLNFTYGLFKKTRFSYQKFN